MHRKTVFKIYHPDHPDLLISTAEHTTRDGDRVTVFTDEGEEVFIAAGHVDADLRLSIAGAMWHLCNTVYAVPEPADA